MGNLLKCWHIDSLRCVTRAASIPTSRDGERFEPPLVYLDQVAGDVTDAYIPQVRYQTEGNSVKIRLRLVSPQRRVEQTFETATRDPKELAKRIVLEFLQMLVAIESK